MKKTGGFYQTGRIVDSITSSPRLVLFWVGLVAFSGFCYASWTTLTIHQTLQYAPAAAVLLFATGLRALRHLHQLNSPK